MPRENSVVTQKTAIAKDWNDPQKLAKVCAYFRSPSKKQDPIDSIDEGILSFVGKKGSRASLKKIMRQLEQFYSPLSVRKLLSMGYLRIEMEQNDLILVRTDKQCHL